MMVTVNKGTEYEQTYNLRDRTWGKYASPMSEYLSLLAMENMEHGSGDVECPTGYFVQIGRRILFNDDRGHVWHETYGDEHGARQVFDALDMYYAEWSDEESDTSEAARMMNLVEYDKYIAYVVECEKQACIAHDFDDWKAWGKASGPIG